MSWVSRDPLPEVSKTDSLFSPMALSAERLERIPQNLLKNGLIRLSSASIASTWGDPSAQKRQPQFEHAQQFEHELHQGQLRPGSVVELSVAGGAALGTTLALHACRHAQHISQQRYGQNVWCAFVDPHGSLYAPGVAALGIDMSRLLIVRPDESSLARVALRLVEAHVFPIVVIDTMGIPGAGVDVSLARWVQVVRRLARAVEGTQSTVVLLTDQTAKRPLPLPVTQRFELVRNSLQQVSLQIARSSMDGRLRSCRLSAQQILKKPHEAQLRAVRQMP